MDEQRNMTIKPSKIKFASYLNTTIIHPHGKQWIPNSMLFGFSSIDELSNRNQYRQDYNMRHRVRSFLKPYWSRSDLKYERLFPATDIFITFGVSLGETDKWWWKHILTELESVNHECELIIYNYDNKEDTGKAKNVKRNFIKNSLSKNSTDLVDKTLKKISDYIYVVNFNDMKPVSFTQPFQK